ncbi:MAG: universal stress protein [Burkholderiales bacterium]
MFKHILIPTDGSPVADKAAKAGIKLAMEIGARVTGYYAVEAIQPRIYGEGYMIGSTTVAELEKRAIAVGEKYLAAMARQAKAAGVRFDSACGTAATPYEGIVDTARKRKCDVIFMASHGRRGLAGFIMGSVTNKVLTHSKLPVIVYR